MKTSPRHIGGGSFASPEMNAGRDQVEREPETNETGRRGLLSLTLALMLALLLAAILAIRNPQPQEHATAFRELDGRPECTQITSLLLAAQVRFAKRGHSRFRFRRRFAGERLHAFRC